ncbi:hypothetical protein LCGC14_1063220 [marine sediment metagenome]|uniref:Uncharacterized protein n=1 Tax=marine sediment metagenome TaxID=412755 RepID=A0A0F9MKJ9_9ZZZZ
MTSLPEERFIMKEENPNQWIDKGLYFFSWEKTRKKAQAIWLKNTLLLPQRVKSNSDQGFALLSSGEEPCPLSLSHGFFTIQPSPSVSIGTTLFFPLFSVREKVAYRLFFC